MKSNKGAFNPRRKTSNTLMDGSQFQADGSIDPSCEDDGRSQASFSSKKQRAADIEKKQQDQGNSPFKKPMTAGAESSENRRRKPDSKVVMPEKGSCRSQYVVRKRAQQEKEDKADTWANVAKYYKNAEVFAVSWTACNAADFFDKGVYDP